MDKTLVALCVTAALAGSIAWSKPALAAEPFIGQIQMVGFNFAPRGWAFCDGQLLPISQNTALFSLLGTTYGGDGRTTFGLPDLRGRVAIHPGTGPGLSNYRWGQKGGSETNTLTVNNLPSHNHTATATLHATDTRGNTSAPSDNIIAQKPRDNDFSTNPPDVTMSADSVSVTVGNTGNGQAVNNMPPYLGLYHCIALVGIFPSRN